MKLRRIIHLIAVLFLLGMVLIFLLNFLWNKHVENLFRQYVQTPIPESVSQIKVDKPNSYGGYTYVFRFNIKQEDYERIRESRSLRKAFNLTCINGRLDWEWELWNPTLTHGAGGVGFPVYSHEPHWYDLPTWVNPEAYAFYKEDNNNNTDIQVLLYNDLLKQAYFITSYHRAGI